MRKRNYSFLSKTGGVWICHNRFHYNNRDTLTVSSGGETSFIIQTYNSYCYNHAYNYNQ